MVKLFKPIREKKVMADKGKVCKNCKRIVSESKCPVCNLSNFSRTWKGLVIINDPNSDIGKMVGATSPGKFCLWAR